MHQPSDEDKSWEIYHGPTPNPRWCDQFVFNLRISAAGAGLNCPWLPWLLRTLSSPPQVGTSTQARESISTKIRFIVRLYIYVYIYYTTWFVHYVYNDRIYTYIVRIYIYMGVDQNIVAGVLLEMTFLCVYTLLLPYLLKFDSRKAAFRLERAILGIKFYKCIIVYTLCFYHTSWNLIPFW